MKRPSNYSRRSIPRLLAGVLAVGATAAVLAAASSSASQSAARTIKLIDDVRHPITFQFLEPPPNPVTGDPTNNAPGDQIVTTNALLNAKHKRIGTAYAVLTFVTGGKLPQHPSVLRDSRVYRLAHGTIFIEELNSGSFADAVVTGGTAAYAGARGTVDEGDPFNVIHLMR
jgi:hypothetical protein